MRYCIVFSYDGTFFSGYQKQIEKRTVQEEIESKLTMINHNVPVIIHASGRTDAKVHALNQVAHFDMDIMDPEELKRKLNKLLPNDIYIKKICIVNNNFHARYNAISKEYIYKINLGEYNPFEVNYVYQYNKKLNIDKMKKGIKYFLGEHDFSSFTKCKKEDNVRIIIDANIVLENDILIISFKGNGFMQYMVRIMVGFLLEIGENKRKPEDVLTVLSAKDRTKAGMTAEPQGLYLKKVNYKEVTM